MFLENFKKRIKNDRVFKGVYWIATSLFKEFIQTGSFNKIFSHNFKPISLGGWCGPTRVIREVSLDPKAYPFDHMRTTFEGICRFFEYDFQDFFPEEPFVSKKIKGHDVYLAKYASFWYHDITKQEVIDALKRRIARLMNLLKTTKKTIVFIRVVVDPEPAKEFSQLKVFNKTMKEKFPNLKYKFVFIVHGQRMGNIQIRAINDVTSVWCVDRSRFDREMDITDYREGYKKIIDFVAKKSNWPPKPDIILSDIKKGNDLWIVDGVPMVIS